MNFLDLFSGIGGFRFGLEEASFKCRGFVEIDPFSRKSYETIHKTEGEWTANDITKVTDKEWRTLRGSIDLICGGFPCQAFSTSGKQGGFGDPRGTLFFEIARAIEQVQPQIVLLENVKNILHHDKGRTLSVIFAEMVRLGYDFEYVVLNGQDFGVPQRRRRVFIIATRSDLTEKILKTDLVFSKKKKQSRIFDILEKEVDKKYFISDEKKANIIKNNKKKALFRPSRWRNVEEDEVMKIANTTKDWDLVKGNQFGAVYSVFGNSPTIEASGPPTVIMDCQEVDKEHGFFLEGDHVVARKLTPKECWRLQGFPDWAFEEAKNAGLSDSQLYKQAGNSVIPSVVAEIGRILKKIEEGRE